MSKRKTRIGIMGFGTIGRQIYHLAANSDDIDVVAVSDIGKTEILHYLLGTTSVQSPNVQVEGNYLINPKFKTRMMQTDHPKETPWDLIDVDIVIETTTKFRSSSDMQGHLDNGARRVLLATPPADHVDRLLIPSINDDAAQEADRMISAGSATAVALAVLLKILNQLSPIASASMTTVHAYTSDQPLQDYAGRNFRRSRSAAENIIPNTVESIPWVEQLLPEMTGKLSGHALNVPVQKGSLLDLNLVFKNPDIGVAEVNDAVIQAKEDFSGILDTVEDPIVSSDVIGNHHSALFDLKGTLKGGHRMIKTLSWYESLGHACRLLDVVRLYQAQNNRGEV